jgi:hypothetical protein
LTKFTNIALAKLRVTIADLGIPNDAENRKTMEAQQLVQLIYNTNRRFSKKNVALFRKKHLDISNFIL